MLLRVQAAAASAGRAADGRGIVVFDCCSGKGLASLVLSVALGALTSLKALSFSIVSRRMAIWISKRLFRIMMKQDIVSRLVENAGCPVCGHVCGQRPSCLPGAF